MSSLQGSTRCQEHTSAAWGNVHMAAEPSKIAGAMTLDCCKKRKEREKGKGLGAALAPSYGKVKLTTISALALRVPDTDFEAPLYDAVTVYEVGEPVYLYWYM